MPAMTWMKKVALGVLVFGACWGGAVWYWRATNRMPSSVDLASWLLVLPLGLLLAGWLGARLIGASGAAPAATAPAVAAPESAPPPSAPPMAILAAALRAPHGSNLEDLAGSMAANRARADLDPELVDDDGFPVMTARSGDADDASLRDQITAWFESTGVHDLYLNGEQWRALVMGSAVAAELAAAASADLLPLEGKAPAMQLLAVLPSEWSAGERRAAGQWLRQVVVAAGWPAAQVALAAELPDEGAASPMSALARLAQHDAANPGALVAIMVACGSHLGEHSIGQWDGGGTLFTSLRPQGLVPGEGAAGLLLTDLATARAVEGAAIAMLHTVDEARRHNSADEAKKSDATVLGALAEKVMLRAAAQASEVAMIVADTGHRTSRVLELLGLASGATPQLDAETDVLRLGTGVGTCGAVPFMTALALGRHHAILLDAPVLCISNEDPYRRCAALIRPAASLS